MHCSMVWIKPVSHALCATLGNAMRGIISLFILLGCLCQSASAAETRHETHPESGIQTWEHHDQGVGFVMMQISPDHARAFFLGRGFDRASVDYYASYCVFMTIVRNESVADAITYQLEDWTYQTQVTSNGKLKLAEDWLKEWQQRNASATSLIAFKWALHPSTQTFEISDWNQGMTTYPLPHGSIFNLTFKWHVNGKPHETQLKNIQCVGE